MGLLQKMWLAVRRLRYGYKGEDLTLAEYRSAKAQPAPRFSNTDCDRIKRLIHDVLTEDTSFLKLLDKDQYYVIEATIRYGSIYLGVFPVESAVRGVESQKAYRSKLIKRAEFRYIYGVTMQEDHSETAELNHAEPGWWNPSYCPAAPYLLSRYPRSLQSLLSEHGMTLSTSPTQSTPRSHE